MKHDGEGNRPTTAVFFVKYPRTLGFDVTNDIFAETRCAIATRTSVV